MSDQTTPSKPTWVNLGSRHLPPVRSAEFPNADEIVNQGLLSTHRSAEAVDILLANPPTPDGALWIRIQHRVGRRTRENMVRSQVSLAQMAALLHPTYKVAIIDANAEHMSWPQFTRLFDKYQPRYYLSQLTAPTLENDMYGVFLAKARGAQTIVFGTHTTPIPVETLRPYPALDFGLYGEPDLTIRDLLDHLEGRIDQRPPEIQRLFERSNPGYQPTLGVDGKPDLSGVKGLVWRRGGEIVMNFPRPFIADLDDLPIPMHELLPLHKYRMPLMKGPFTFIVTSRGCTAGCVLHQTRQLPVQRTLTLTQAHYGRAVEAQRVGHPLHQYVL